MNLDKDEVVRFPAYQSTEKVRAGRIVAVHPTGCVVRRAYTDLEDSDSGTSFCLYPDGMTDQYIPVRNDFWIFYEDGHQSICPLKQFLERHIPIRNMTWGNPPPEKIVR